MALYLNAYGSLSYKFVPGVTNVVADPLSRLIDPATEQSNEEPFTMQQSFPAMHQAMKECQSNEDRKDQIPRNVHVSILSLNDSVSASSISTISFSNQQVYIASFKAIDSGPKIDRKLQLECPALNSIIRSIEDKNDSRHYARSQFYKVQGGILFNESPTPHPVTNEDVWRVCVPTSLRKTTFDSFHSHLGCHYGSTSTINRVSAFYSWPGFCNYIRKSVKECNICSSLRARRRHLHTGTSTTSHLFDTVAIDFVGPFAPSAKGNRYLLTFIIVDVGYPEAVPVRDPTAKVASKHFLDITVARCGLLDSTRLGFKQSFSASGDVKVTVSRNVATGSSIKSNWDEYVSASSFAMRTNVPA
eukprot:CAMPEP_0167767554 /NCGR_PEP_ID=MMETSP0110_2-20121227/16122_1 /TAXON_ID=629695 /ORGANISM="Gymnochlora sp., Strain CCMP2014" /LENGTH=358 /DNA_ID=CAMNT_0007656021 /DNA_START=320 /DNA_END=1394 /DNA_ORIENTATION=+